MSVFVKSSLFFKAVFQRHDWTYASEHEGAPRTCAVCGEHQVLEEDEWGFNYGTVRPGDLLLHGSVIDSTRRSSKTARPAAPVAPGIAADLGQELG